MPRQIGLFHDVFDRWESITKNYVTMQGITDATEKVEFIENLLGEMRKKQTWIQWRMMYPTEFETIITRAEEERGTQNILSQIRRVFSLEDPATGTTHIQDQAYRDLERLTCNNVKDLVQYLNDFGRLAAKQEGWRLPENPLCLSVHGTGMQERSFPEKLEEPGLLQRHTFARILWHSPRECPNERRNVRRVAVFENLALPDDYEIVSVQDGEEESDAIYSLSENENGVDLEPVVEQQRQKRLASCSGKKTTRIGKSKKRSQYERENNNLYNMTVEVDIPGVPKFSLRAILDTGATVCCVDSKALPKEAIEDNTFEVHFRGINSKQSVNKKMKYGRMSVGGHNFRIPYTYTFPMDLGGKIQFILGCNFIRKHGRKAPITSPTSSRRWSSSDKPSLEDHKGLRGFSWAHQPMQGRISLIWADCLRPHSNAQTSPTGDTNRFSPKEDWKLGQQHPDRRRKRADSKKYRNGLAYGSGSLKIPKSTIDAEITAVIKALESFKIYYLDKQCLVIRTDCQAIVSFFNKSCNHKPSRVRWVSLVDYITGMGLEVKFEHIDGKENQLADVLSRLISMFIFSGEQERCQALAGDVDNGLRELPGVPPRVFEKNEIPAHQLSNQEYPYFLAYDGLLQQERLQMEGRRCIPLDLSNALTRQRTNLEDEACQESHHCSP
ncbi:Retrotransposon protein, putative, Ty3-gypsy subclass [Melia azedarach]|uniref:Retrotransposon protein, putative, Ty3-gypsy subclass n=1 Tax=Melia azedarach TaxID=155640 RepID=A0ACC1XUI1_MELAZ|nr:Retrotransposon protein, putative, Ty3-gypsy subclass [Melia azedarach]